MSIHITDMYQSGKSWYRKYSNGWVEQGGYVSGAVDATVKLLVPMKDTNYTLLTSKSMYAGENGDGGSHVINTYNKTSTSFSICAWGQGGRSFKSSATGFWSVYGYGAK